MSVADLKKRYEQVYGKGASSGSADLNVATVAASPDKIQAYAEEIAKYCEVANELAGLSPEEYAAREEDQRLIDSMLFQAIKYFRSVGGTDADLNKYDNYKRLDQERTKRLNDEYMRNHPEMAM